MKLALLILGIAGIIVVYFRGACKPSARPQLKPRRQIQAETELQLQRLRDGGM